MKANYVAWLITLSGVMFVTLGHFIEVWWIVYVFCPVVGLMTAIVLDGIGE